MARITSRAATAANALRTTRAKQAEEAKRAAEQAAAQAVADRRARTVARSKVTADVLKNFRDRQEQPEQPAQPSQSVKSFTGRYGVSSSAISSYTYDRDSQTLTVNFRQRGSHSYNVPQSVADGLEDAGSKGSYFNSVIFPLDPGASTRRS